MECIHSSILEILAASHRQREFTEQADYVKQRLQEKYGTFAQIACLGS
jgi:hypothetical protein